MASEFTESGYVIHSRAFKERSLLLELFTVNHGRLCAVANLGKTDLHGYKAALRPFEPLQFSLLQGRSELLTLKEVRRCSNEVPLCIPKLFCAEYLNELLHYLYRDDESSPKLFASYIRALKTLRSEVNAQEQECALRDFESELLQNLGYALDFHAPNGKWEEDEFFVYSPDNGFVLSDENTDCSLSGAILNELSQGGELSSQARRGLKIINRLALTHLLGNRTLKSRELYSEFLRQIA